VSIQPELPLDWPPEPREKMYERLTGKTVRVTVPVDFWTDDWHDGMRARVYVGRVCGCHRGGFCLQPPDRAQGLPEERGRCFPLADAMTFEKLPGRLADY
jgi:hypothetical protein